MLRAARCFVWGRGVNWRGSERQLLAGAGRGDAPALERTRGAVADARSRKQRWSRHCEGGRARERGARSHGGAQRERGPETAAEHAPLSAAGEVGRDVRAMRLKLRTN